MFMREDNPKYIEGAALTSVLGPRIREVAYQGGCCLFREEKGSLDAFQLSSRRLASTASHHHTVDIEASTLVPALDFHCHPSNII